jgi:hypothetical protein
MGSQSVVVDVRIPAVITHIGQAGKQKDGKKHENIDGANIS